MELIYRGSRDGTTSNIFHNKYDNKGPTIIFYLKMIKEIFMEDIVQYLGILMEDGNLFLKHLFLH